MSTLLGSLFLRGAALDPLHRIGESACASFESLLTVRVTGELSFVAMCKSPLSSRSVCSVS